MQIRLECRVRRMMIRYKLTEDSNVWEDVLYADDTSAVTSDKLQTQMNLHIGLEIKVVYLGYLKNNISIINITNIIECFKKWKNYL